MSDTMRTRILTSMTNGEVENYLKRNDVIIVPVGVVETHGMYPLDVEYVLAEAYARLIAEQVDGLVLPNLMYFHPGATQVGRGTVHMSMTNSFRYMTAIAESLLAQGFRHQIYIPGHHPTSEFLLAMTTEVFDNTKVPIMYLDVMSYLMANGIRKPWDFSKPFPPFKMISDDEGPGDHATWIGAYKICNRLHDFPTGAEVNDERYLSSAYEKTEGDLAYERIQQKRPTALAYSPAFYYNDISIHGSELLPLTREEIEHEAEVGEKILRDEIAQGEFAEIVRLLKVHDEHINTTVMKNHGDHLPKNKWSPNVAWGSKE